MMKTLLRFGLSAVVTFAAVAHAQDAAGEVEGKEEAAAPKTEEKALDVTLLPFSPDSIKRVVAFHQPKIQACYEDMLAGRRKPVEGQLMTSFVITPEGLVKRAKVVKKGTTLKDAKLNDCVVATLSSMNFPKPPNGKNQPIEYPFNLKAVN